MEAQKKSLLFLFVFCDVAFGLCNNSFIGRSFLQGRKTNTWCYSIPDEDCDNWFVMNVAEVGGLAGYVDQECSGGCALCQMTNRGCRAGKVYKDCYAFHQPPMLPAPSPPPSPAPPPNVGTLSEEALTLIARLVPLLEDLSGLLAMLAQVNSST